MTSAGESLELAERHLEKVLAAAIDPTDWLDLALYGFYCLENAVMAAALRLNVPVARSHASKLGVARALHEEHGQPECASLLERLNQARKAVAYGDVDLPDLDADDVAEEIAEYVGAVRRLLSGGGA